MADGGLSGGALLHAHLAAIAARLGNADSVRVGFLEGATYPDGTPVPLVAAANEFGDPARGRPARPYFRQMIAAKSPGWGVTFSKVLVAADYDADKALALMGAGVADQLRESIRSFDGPALAPSTVAAKGFDKQLIDTSVMLNSVDYEVGSA